MLFNTFTEASQDWELLNLDLSYDEKNGIKNDFNLFNNILKVSPNLHLVKLCCKENFHKTLSITPFIKFFKVAEIKQVQNIP